MANTQALLLDQLQKLTGGLTPLEALEIFGTAARDLLQQLDEEARATYILNLLRDHTGDKTASMVHL